MRALRIPPSSWPGPPGVDGHRGAHVTAHIAGHPPARVALRASVVLGALLLSLMLVSCGGRADSGTDETDVLAGPTRPSSASPSLPSADNPGSPSGLGGSASSGPAARQWTSPPAGAGFDYQLAGPYPPPPGVSVVARDRTAEPAGAGYDICYVNGFQTQPGESEAFAAAHPDLLVQTAQGPLVDPGWPDEYLFDTSTPDRRQALTAVVTPWIQGCAAAGYQAVEFDNLDSYTRSQDRLDLQDNLALARAYADIAHGVGLAVGQKNTADQSAQLRGAGYDFAVTESCMRYQECGAYTDQYPVVLDIEYVEELGEGDSARACAEPDRPASMILRDHDLVTRDDPGYLYRSCDG